MITLLLSMLPVYANECDYKTLKSTECKMYKYETPYKFKCIKGKEYLYFNGKLLPVVDNVGKQKKCTEVK